MANELCRAFGLAPEEVVGQSAFLGTESPAPATVIAYLAGIVDGEGSIGIKAYDVDRRNGYAQYAAFVTVGMCERGSLDLFHALFGGHFHVKRLLNPRHRTQFAWAASHRVAVRCLAALLPYLRVKHEQALNALALQSLIRRGAYGGRPRPAHVTAEMERLYHRAAELNARGEAAIERDLRAIF